MPSKHSGEPLGEETEFTGRTSPDGIVHLGLAGSKITLCGKKSAGWPEGPVPSARLAPWCRDGCFNAGSILSSAGLQ